MKVIIKLTRPSLYSRTHLLETKENRSTLRQHKVSDDAKGDAELAQAIVEEDYSMFVAGGGTVKIVSYVSKCVDPTPSAITKRFQEDALDAMDYGDCDIY